MSETDLFFFYLVNQFAGESPVLDSVILHISNNHLLKGGATVLILWYLWFQKGKKNKNRPAIILTFLGCFITIFLARVLQLFLPYRYRPIHEPPADYILPINMPHDYAVGMSSFPSDHAALFFALAGGVYLVSKKLGLFTLLYAFVIICLPRIFLGLHYPSDILGGAIVGISVIVILNYLTISDYIVNSVGKMKKAYPGIFYCCFFLITYQIADMFESSRALVRFTLDLLTG